MKDKYKVCGQIDNSQSLELEITRNSLVGKVPLEIEAEIMVDLTTKNDKSILVALEVFLDDNLVWKEFLTIGGKKIGTARCTVDLYQGRYLITGESVRISLSTENEQQINGKIEFSCYER